MSIRKMNNVEAVLETLTYADKRVLDVGCGDGSMTRLLAKEASEVIGIDCNPKQLEKARGSRRVDNEKYLEAVGEKLPFTDAEFDIVLMFNSLHHIPEASMSEAIREAARVLRTDGIFACFEPIARGPNFEAKKPVDDETTVRDLALLSLQQAGDAGLTEVTAFEYENEITCADFEHFWEKSLRINQNRKERFNALEPALRELFAKYGKHGLNGYVFAQPMRVKIFQKS